LGEAPPTLHFSSIRRSMLGVRCSMFISPKEWWTPIRHVHGESMRGENHFSLPPHGQAIRRSPLLAKRHLPLFISLPFDVRCWAFDVRCSSPLQGVVDSDPPCPWQANARRKSLLIVPTWTGASEITSPWESERTRLIFVGSPALEGVLCPNEDALKGWTTCEDWKFSVAASFSSHASTVG
jgi:hypothetical protein